MRAFPVPVETALTYSLDPLARIVHITYAASPSFEEWAGMMRAIFQDAEYAPGWGLLSDRRSVREPQTKDFIQAVVAFLRRHQRELDHGRWAMVVSGIAVYGMARMAQELAGELPVKLGVFTDMDEAWEWLSLPPDPSSR
jgi:hypothetical protein